MMKRKMAGFKKPAVDLSVGDLVMWLGKPSEYSMLQRRLIYVVVERQEPAKAEFMVQYRYRPVFDIENPIGVPVEPTGLMSSREMKHLDILDLGVMRMLFDEFIKSWALQYGKDPDPEPAEEG